MRPRFPARGREGYSARRRKVRIVKPRRSTRAATISLASVALAAVVFFLIWRFWEEEEPAPIFRRGLPDVVLDWKCESGHTFKARGQVAPRACPTCRRPAFPVGTYHCPKHGAFELTIRYADEDGVARPVEYRIAGGKWIPVSDGARCPRCSTPLERRPKDPFARKRRSSRRREGR